MGERMEAFPPGADAGGVRVRRRSMVAMPWFGGDGVSGSALACVCL
jgi:hypothetical protein